MLIPRPDRQVAPAAETTVTRAAAGLDRRAFLRRSGLIAGGLAGLGLLPAGSIRKAAAGPPPPPGLQIIRRKNICTHCSVGCSVIAEVVNDVWVGQEPDYRQPDQPGLALLQGSGGA